MDDPHTESRLHAQDRRIDRCEGELAQMTKVITNLMHSVWGNGKDGLTTRVDRIEQRTLSEAESRKQTATMVSAIGAAAMALLSLAVQAIIAWAGK